jgi:two-component system, response regulator
MTWQVFRTPELGVDRPHDTTITETLPGVYQGFMLAGYDSAMKAKKSCMTDSSTNGDIGLMNGGAVDILVVEDNDSERDSIVLALQVAIPDVNVVAVGTGDEAMDFLYGRDAWRERAGEDAPKLILLDLALPGADGFSLLGQIRSFDAEEAITLTPVVIFTDSQTTGDILKSYRCGANSYIFKPLTYSDFQTVVESVGRYWMTHNRASLRTSGTRKEREDGID